MFAYCRNAILVFAIFTLSLSAQTLEERVRTLEEQNRQLIQQNQRLTSSHNQVLDRLSTTERNNQALVERIERREGHEDNRLETMLKGLEDMIESEGGGSASASSYGRDYLTRYDLTRSGSKLQFYGRLRLDLYHNTARFDRAIDPRWVRPEDGINASEDDDAFALDSRNTTIGLNYDFGPIAGTRRTAAKVEFDFGGFSSETESRAGARLLLAYIDLNFGSWSLRFGQDWDVISPYDPIVDQHRHLWDTGNLGDRRPMIQAAYHGGSRRGIEYDFRVALGTTGAVNAEDADTGFGTFLTTELDGVDSGIPHLQVAASITVDSWVRGDRMTIGLSGLIARLETDTRLNGERHFDSWMLGVDFFIPIFAGVHLKGEAFIGSALGDWRGGIGQSINRSTGDEIDTMGGFAELFWQATKRFGIGVGASIDNPEFDDLEVASRASNWTAYVATRYDLGGGLQLGLDAIFWKTQYVGREDGDAWRFNAFIEIGF
ncbi:MAG: cell division protein ZapB [Planctomycetota bacterium]